MCLNATCPSALHCYRFTALSGGGWQSYGEFSLKDGATRCDHFMPNEAGKRAEQKISKQKKTDKTCATAPTGRV